MSKNHVFVDLAPQKTLQAEENDKKTCTLCWIAAIGVVAVSYTHLTLPTILRV